MFSLRTMLLFAFVLSLPISATAEYIPNDFDKICTYFTDMSKLANVKRMTHMQRNKYINKRIAKGLDPHGTAAVAWKSVSHAKAKQRYDLFISSAQSSLRQPWSCNAMEVWADKTGKVK